MVNELFLTIESASVAFDDKLTKLNSFLEYAVRDNLIKCEKAELKVMQESGTMDDLVALYEASAEEFGNRLKKTVEKIIKSFCDFVDGIMDKVHAVFDGKDLTRVIAAAKDRCAIEPDFANQVITFNTYMHIVNAGIQKHLALNALLEALIAGASWNSVIQAFADIEKKYDGKLDFSEKNTSVQTTRVRFAEFCSICDQKIKESQKHILEVDKEKMKYSKMNTDKFVNEYQVRILREMVTCQKIVVRAISKEIHELVTTIKKAIGTTSPEVAEKKADAAKDNKSDEVKQESADAGSFDAFMDEIAALMA